MAVSISDVKKVAALSKLHLSDAECETYAKQFSDILSHMTQLNNLNTDKIEPTYSVLSVPTALREDCIVSNDTMARLVTQAPEKENGYFVVPQVI